MQNRFFERDAGFMNDGTYVSKVFTGQSSFTSSIEGPACDREGNLYAVNYAKDQTIGKVTSQGEGSIYIELPGKSKASGIRFNRSGDMFIADHRCHNVFKLDAATKQLRVYAHEPSMNQPNDLAITADGILFASDPNWKEATGNIWRIDLDRTVVLLEADMGTTNGIEVSPDEKILYVNETVQRTIWAYDLSSNYEISNKRLLVEFPDFGLDGMRCDSAGNLYVTRYGKGTIAVISPSGEMIREVKLHGKNCTNLTFGGPDGKTCYVTLADACNIEMFRTDIPGRCWSMWGREKEE